MAVLSSAAKAQVVSNSLPRINSATSVVELLQIAATRVNSMCWASEAQVLAGKRLSGIIPQGGNSANVLTGKNGLGKAHVSLKTQVGLCAVAPKEGQTSAEGLAFLQSLNAAAPTATLEQLREMYYQFVDGVTIPLVVWQDTEPEVFKAVTSGRGKYTGTLRADGDTGNVSFGNASVEEDVDVTPLPKRIATSIAAPATPAAPAMRMFNGMPIAESALQAFGVDFAALPLA